MIISQLATNSVEASNLHTTSTHQLKELPLLDDIVDSASSIKPSPGAALPSDITQASSRNLESQGGDTTDFSEADDLLKNMKQQTQDQTYSPRDDSHLDGTKSYANEPDETKTASRGSAKGMDGALSKQVSPTPTHMLSGSKQGSEMPAAQRSFNGKVDEFCLMV